MHESKTQRQVNKILSLVETEEDTSMSQDSTLHRVLLLVEVMLKRRDVEEAETHMPYLLF